MYALADRLDPDSYRDLATAAFAEMVLAGFTCVGEFHYLHHGRGGIRYARPNEMGQALLDAAAAAGAIAHPRNVGVIVGNLDDAVIEGDPELVRRLMMILLDNAIKFTAAGSEVRVSVFKSDGTATLVVEDNGVGIPADQLAHVFDRFYRGDPARSRSEGAGLGLSIARWITDVHQGHIDVESAERKGTRVAVRFPSVAQGMSSS